MRPHLDWDRQKGDEQKILWVGDQTITIDIKHLEELAVLHTRHMLP